MSPATGAWIFIVVYVIFCVFVLAFFKGLRPKPPAPVLSQANADRAQRQADRSNCQPIPCDFEDNYVCHTHQEQANRHA